MQKRHGSRTWSANYKAGTVLSSHQDLPATQGGKYYFYLHSTDEETGWKRLSNSLGNDRVRIRTQVSLDTKAHTWLLIGSLGQGAKGLLTAWVNTQPLPQVCGQLTG